MRNNLWIALGILLCACGAVAGESDRDAIVSRMQEFLSITLSTNEQVDDVCLVGNLQHPNLVGGQYNTSDILWHSDFLNGSLAHVGWWGMPYAYGNGHTPDNSPQSAYNACKAVGNHKEDYNAHSCGYPGCSWSGGADCSTAVSYAGGISRYGTCDLASTTCGVQISSWDQVKKASYLSLCDSHVVLVESRSGSSVTVLEATGAYPVSCRSDKSQSDYSSYTYWDFKDVAAAEGSDGLLIVRVAGGGVELIWSIESAHSARWYEFQYWNEAAGIWVTFDEQDFRGTGEYRSNCSAEGAESLIYRVRENEWGGRRLPHCETRAIGAS